MKYILLVLSLLTFIACEKPDQKTEFWVRGNCSMCEKTIESAITSIDGVTSAEWDRDTKMVKVEFVSSKTNESEIKKAAPAAGHETKEIEANSEAYKNLPMCCKKREDTDL